MTNDKSITTQQNQNETDIIGWKMNMGESAVSMLESGILSARESQLK